MRLDRRLSSCLLFFLLLPLLPAEKYRRSHPRWEEQERAAGSRRNHDWERSPNHNPQISQSERISTTAPVSASVSQHRRQPFTPPLYAPLTRILPSKSPRANNGGIQALVPAPNIFQSRRPIPTFFPGQVSYFYSPQEQALYKVTRIRLDSGPSPSHPPQPALEPSEEAPLLHLPHPAPHSSHLTHPPETPSSTTAAPPSPRPTRRRTASPPPTTAPPTPSDTPDRKRKKYKLKFEFVLDEPEDDETLAKQSEIATTPALQ